MKRIESHPSVDKVEERKSNSPEEEDIVHTVVTLKEGISDSSFIPELLVPAGFRLTMLKEEEINLETAFMRLTKGITN